MENKKVKKITLRDVLDAGLKVTMASLKSGRFGTIGEPRTLFMIARGKNDELVIALVHGVNEIRSSFSRYRLIATASDPQLVGLLQARATERCAACETKDL